MNMDLLEQRIMRLSPIPVPERKNKVSDARHPLLTYSWNYSAVGEEILEFGVAGGQSLQTIRKATLGLPFDADFPTSRDDDPLIYGFDSWEGLPEAWSVAEDDLRPAGKYKTNPPQRLEERRIKLINGLFKDSIPKWLEEYNPGNIRFAHIDCDIYSSTVQVLFLLNDIELL